MLKAHPYFTPIHTYKATESHTHRPKTRSFTIQFDADANLSQIKKLCKVWICAHYFLKHDLCHHQNSIPNNAIKIQFIIDRLAKSPKFPFPVIPDKAEIQYLQYVLDDGGRRQGLSGNFYDSSFFKADIDLQELQESSEPTPSMSF